mmetsp:Transcript_59954/g.106672  ORF Transcript_59954/g.106672 Transcript_59954/m.106672 type:complete len:249 (-) Transcript_59954:58-804(-)
MMPGMMPGMMPPMMPGMMPGMMNPAMAMMGNPMMAMMMAGMAATEEAEAPAKKEAEAKPGETPIDSRVRDICRSFSIEDRLMRKLNDVMMRRPETFEEDLQMVSNRLSKERPDIGVIIRQLDKGTFVTTSDISPEMKEIVDKYKLDDRATSRLVESMRRRKKTMYQDLKAIDARLSSAERPSGLLMTLLQGLDTEGKLPAPPKALGLSGSYHNEPDEKDKDTKDDRRGRDKDRTKKRSRSRSRSRRRR